VTTTAEIQDIEENLETILGDIFCAVNIEPKAIVLAKCLRLDEERDPSIIKYDYSYWAKWPTDINNFESYCEQTFKDFGFVKEGENGWKFTEFADKYVRPIAGYLIYVSNQMMRSPSNSERL